MMNAIINSYYSLNMNFKTFKQSIKVTYLNVTQKNLFVN